MVQSNTSMVSMLGAPPAPLALRVMNGSQRGKTVQLSAAKCTVGSGPECTLRLRGAGLERLQCVILRGEQRTVIRNWQGSTRLNQRPLGDGLLQLGDRIGLGAVELEVVTSDAHEAFHPESARRQVAQLAEVVQTTRRQARGRMRRLLDRMRKLKHRQADWDARRQQIAQEMAALQAERAALADQKAELALHRVDLDAHRRQLQQDAAQLTERTTAQAQQLTVRETELDARHQQLVARHTQLDAEFAALAMAQTTISSDRQQFERTLGEQQAAISRRQTEAELTWRELTRREDDLNQQAEHLRCQSTELEATRRVWEQDHLQWLAERERLNAGWYAQQLEVEQRRAECDTLRQELDKHEAELARREAALANQQQAQGAQLALSSDVARLRAELDSARLKWEQERAAWTVQTLERDETLRQQQDKLTGMERDVAQRQRQLDGWSREIDERHQQHERDTASLEQAKQQLEAQRNELLAQQSAFMAPLAERQGSLQQAEHDYVERTLASQQREAALAERERSLAAQVAEFESRQQACAATEQELTAREAALQSQGAALEADRQLLAEEQVGKTDQQWLLAEQQQQLAADRGALEAEQQALVAERTQLANNRTEIEQAQSRLAAAHETLATEQRELAERQTAIEARQAELTRMEATLDEQQQLLNRREEAYARDAAELLTAQETLQLEREHWSQQLAERASTPVDTTALAAKEQELADTQQKLAIERADVELRQQQLSAQSQQLADQTRQLESLQQTLEERRQRLDTELAAREKTIEDRGVQIARSEGDAVGQSAERGYDPAADVERIIRQLRESSHHTDDVQLPQGFDDEQPAAADVANEETLGDDTSSGYEPATESVVDEQESATAQTDEEPSTSEADETSEPSAEEPANENTSGQCSGLSSAALLAKYGVNFDDEAVSEPKPSRQRQVSLESISSARRSASERNMPVEPAAVAPAPAALVENEEDDIGNYMAQLLARNGGRSTQPAASTAPASKPEPASKSESAAKSEPSSKPTEPKPAPRTRLPEPADVAEANVDNDAPLTPRAMAPRSLPPEMSANLSAMRELANMNAQNAISAHRKQQITSKKSGTLLLALVGGLCTTAAAGIHFVLEHPMALYGMLAGLVVTLLWGGKYFNMALKLKRDQKA
ncbi:MAG: hypothetical protein JSS27_06895 [Planctomycetes bacterium]|nr:hypothetical protein [Planctomycetota bacterium]